MWLKSVFLYKLFRKFKKTKLGKPIRAKYVNKSLVYKGKVTKITKCDWKLYL